jgi:hypothetical protein
MITRRSLVLDGLAVKPRQVGEFADPGDLRGRGAQWSRCSSPGVVIDYLAWPGAGSAPVSIALVTAAVRPETPSLAQARSRCVFTVASLR